SYTAGKPVPIAGIYKGLSGMRGNLHVPFLGGGGAVMRRCYPTACRLKGERKKLKVAHAQKGKIVRSH
ncbi:hypothetical protein, partial [Pantoea agglomerans]|uniref:hypothetical protein n=1 Tax=Enterobacter agglomerans TaxID=549 RepID=UPI003209F545